MSWRFVVETGLNLSHKLMLLVFVATPVKLILGSDEVNVVVDSEPSCSHIPTSCEVSENGVLVNILLWEVYLFICLKITCHIEF